MVVIPNCNFIKPDGVRCGSPALRGMRLCYFHARRRPKPRPVVPEVPDPTDTTAVLNWLMYRLMKGTLDTRAAGQIIYSLQQQLILGRESGPSPRPWRVGG